MNKSSIDAFLSVINGNEAISEAIKSQAPDFKQKNTVQENDIASWIISSLNRYHTFDKVFEGLEINYHDHFEAITIILNNYAISQYIKSHHNDMKEIILSLKNQNDSKKAYQELEQNFNNLLENPLKLSEKNMKILNDLAIRNCEDRSVQPARIYFETLFKFLKKDERISVSNPTLNSDDDSAVDITKYNFEYVAVKPMNNLTIKSFLPKLLLSKNFMETRQDASLFWSKLNSIKTKEWAIKIGIFPEKGPLNDTFIASAFGRCVGRFPIKDVLTFYAFKTFVEQPIYDFLWIEMSRAMASRAIGIVFVLSPEEMGPILSEVELPALKSNEKVSSIVHINAENPQCMISLLSRNQSGEMIEYKPCEIDYRASFYDPSNTFHPKDKPWLLQDSMFMAVAILHENAALFIDLKLQLPLIKSMRFYSSDSTSQDIDPEILPSDFIIENLCYQNKSLILSKDDRKFELKQQWLSLFDDATAKALFIDLFYGMSIKVEKPNHDSMPIDCESVFFKVAKSQHAFIAPHIECNQKDEFSLVHKVVQAQCEYIVFIHEQKYGPSNELSLFQISSDLLLIQQMIPTKELLMDQRNYLKRQHADNSFSFLCSHIENAFSSSDNLLNKLNVIMIAQNNIILDRYVDSIDENIRKILAIERECISLLSEKKLNYSQEHSDSYLLLTQEYLHEQPQESFLDKLIRAQSAYIFYVSTGIKNLLDSRIRKAQEHNCAVSK